MNKTTKIIIVVVLLLAVGAVIALKENNKTDSESKAPENTTAQKPEALPRLVDLGAGKCIPCKMMAPILEELKENYSGIFDVEFIDVRENPDAGKKYGIKIIPTQIFYDVSGKELFRHEGFFSKEDILAKWKEFGVDLTEKKTLSFSRLDPAKPDVRPADTVCYMCDGDINPKTQVFLSTDKGDVRLCCPHCYFITYSSLLEKDGVDQKASVTDWKSGKKVSATEAFYLYGMDDFGRPAIKVFAKKADAESEQNLSQGNILNWETLRNKEMTHQCGFCDRVVYPEDSAKVIVGSGMQTWGCCPMCALGVAVRTQKNIEVFQKDALTGEMIHVKTINGGVSLLEPETAVAWSGKKKLPDGKLASAGCFKQAFFIKEENLKKWVEQHPAATGMMVPIHKALAAKMKLTEQQIKNACKIGECAPR